VVGHKYRKERMSTELGSRFVLSETDCINIPNRLLIRYGYALKSPRAMCRGVNNLDDGEAYSLRNVGQ
jgi:hypothetical protein